jgi:hypothetical protein
VQHVYFCSDFLRLARRKVESGAGHRGWKPFDVWECLQQQKRRFLTPSHDSRRELLAHGDIPAAEKARRVREFLAAPWRADGIASVRFNSRGEIVPAKLAGGSPRRRTVDELLKGQVKSGAQFVPELAQLLW